MTESIIFGLLVIALVSARLIYQDRFQQCPSCGKFALSSGEVYRISCINESTGNHYPEARIHYKCRDCGCRPVKNFADKWIETD